MTLSTQINALILKVLQSSTWTSAGGKNPVDNFIKEPRGFENIDLEAEILSSQADNPEAQKRNKDIDDNIDDVGFFKAGNVGAIQGFSSSQFANIRLLASSPVAFFTAILSRNIIKIISVVGIAILAKEVAGFVMGEFAKPGRPWDPRFKRRLQQEFSVFISRKEKQELVSGRREVRVTTIQGLRGGQGMVSGNLFTHSGLDLLGRQPNAPFYKPTPKSFGFLKTPASVASGNLAIS